MQDRCYTKRSFQRVIISCALSPHAGGVGTFCSALAPSYPITADGPLCAETSLATIRPRLRASLFTVRGSLQGGSPDKIKKSLKSCVRRSAVFFITLNRLHPVHQPYMLHHRVVTLFTFARGRRFIRPTGQRREDVHKNVLLRRRTGGSVVRLDQRHSGTVEGPPGGTHARFRRAGTGRTLRPRARDLVGGVHVVFVVGEEQYLVTDVINVSKIFLTRNSLDCDQSNYSSRIVFSYIPIEFGQTGISAIRMLHSGDMAI